MREITVLPPSFSNPLHSGTVIGMEMQLSSLSHLVSKLMVKTRTTINTRYHEVLHAQIMKLQYQMEQSSLSLQTEKCQGCIG